MSKIEIAAEQKEKIAAIDQEFAEAFAALKKTRADILTADQKKAEKEANAANKAVGKTGAEAKKAVETALNLTDEQKATVLADIDKLVNSAGWKAALETKGWANTYLAGADFDAQLAKEIEATTAVLKDIGLVQ